MERYGKRVWQAPVLRKARLYRGIFWDPSQNWGPPGQGWKLFFMEFEFGNLLHMTDCISTYICVDQYI